MRGIICYALGKSEHFNLRFSLTNYSAPLYERSRTEDENNTDGTISDHRTSTTAFLPDGDPIVERIIARSSEFQGYTKRSDHEALQLTRYQTGQQFRPHLDSLPKSNETSRNRITTIFAVLESTCDTCGTRFPEMAVNWSREDERWCQFVNCNDTEGITINAVPGNALFWRNMDNSNVADPRTYHAGLPPEKGVKTGLNIWTRG
jgi:prolyl 4-hydroxylase